MDKAYLILACGEVFEGYRFGADADVIGETVFTTGVTGYLETLTDMSYFGQIITQTFPLIGNYGVIPEDFESRTPAARGYIVRQWCQDPSNFRSEGSLDTFLKAHGVTGLWGIDTRRLTKLLREAGTMNGLITHDPAYADAAAACKHGQKLKPEHIPERLRAFEIINAVAACSTKEAYSLKGSGNVLRIALMDYGAKDNIKRELLSRVFEVRVFPHDTPAEAVIKYHPDGIMLSNGPGDPRSSENAPIVENLKKLCKTGIPIFGICFGNQLLALAHGFKIEKLKYGHRGANQPSKDLTTGRVHITTQNHGYAVVSDSIDPTKAVEWMINVNDNTNEGVIYKNAAGGSHISSVQFHPEAAAGPRDTRFLFDRFIAQCLA